MYDGGFGWGMFGIFGLLWMLLFFVGLVLLIVWLVRQFSQDGERSGSRGSGGRSAIRILEERYARGEIDRDEYLTRRADLEGKET